MSLRQLKFKPKFQVPASKQNNEQALKNESPVNQSIGQQNVNNHKGCTEELLQKGVHVQEVDSSSGLPPNGVSPHISTKPSVHVEDHLVALHNTTGSKPSPVHLKRNFPRPNIAPAVTRHPQSECSSGIPTHAENEKKCVDSDISKTVLNDSKGSNLSSVPLKFTLDESHVVSEFTTNTQSESSSGITTNTESEKTSNSNENSKSSVSVLNNTRGKVSFSLRQFKFKPKLQVGSKLISHFGTNAENIDNNEDFDIDKNTLSNDKEVVSGLHETQSVSTVSQPSPVPLKLSFHKPNIVSGATRSPQTNKASSRIRARTECEQKSVDSVISEPSPVPDEPKGNTQELDLDNVHVLDDNVSSSGLPSNSVAADLSKPSDLVIDNFVASPLNTNKCSISPARHNTKGSKPPSVHLKRSLHKPNIAPAVTRFLQNGCSSGIPTHTECEKETIDLSKANLNVLNEPKGSKTSLVHLKHSFHKPNIVPGLTRYPQSESSSGIASNTESNQNFVDSGISKASLPVLNDPKGSKPSPVQLKLNLHKPNIAPPVTRHPQSESSSGIPTHTESEKKYVDSDISKASLTVLNDSKENKPCLKPKRSLTIPNILPGLTRTPQSECSSEITTPTGSEQSVKSVDTDISQASSFSTVLNDAKGSKPPPAHLKRMFRKPNILPQTKRTPQNECSAEITTNNESEQTSFDSDILKSHSVLNDSKVSKRLPATLKHKPRMTKPSILPVLTKTPQIECSLENTNQTESEHKSVDTDTSKASPSVLNDPKGSKLSSVHLKRRLHRPNIAPAVTRHPQSECSSGIARNTESEQNSSSVGSDISKVTPVLDDLKDISSMDCNRSKASYRTSESSEEEDMKPKSKNRQNKRTSNQIRSNCNDKTNSNSISSAESTSLSDTSENETDEPIYPKRRKPKRRNSSRKMKLIDLEESESKDSPKKRKGKLNALHGSKSIRSCHLGDPFKPKLTNRVKRPFAAASFRKMNLEVKKQCMERFGDVQPDSSKFTLMESILCVDKPESSSVTEATETCVEVRQETFSDEEIVSNSISNSTETTQSDCIITNDEEPVPRIEISAQGKLTVSNDNLGVSQELMDLIPLPTTRMKKKKKVEDANLWSSDETIKFFKALNVIGADFETMQLIFPFRSRKSLKNKFKTEERRRSDLIDKILRKPGEFKVDDALEELGLKENAPDRHGRPLQSRKNDNPRHKSALSLFAGRGKKGSSKSSNRREKVAFDENLTSESDVEDEQKAEKQQNVKNKEDDVENERDLQNKNDVEQVKKRRKVVKRKKTYRQKARQAYNEIKHPFRTSSRLKNLFKATDSNGKETMEQKEEIKNKEKEDKIAEAKKILIHTNFEIDNMKYTRSVTYDIFDLEHPLEIHETIAHDVSSMSHKRTN